MASSEVYVELAAEVDRQDAIHPSGYPATRDGLRLAIATGEDELREALEAWRRGRCKCPEPMCDHHDWTEAEGELLQAAAVICRTLRALREHDHAQMYVAEEEISGT